MTFRGLLVSMGLQSTAPKTGHHRHKCLNCDNVWEHSNNMAGDEKAHTCVKCGEQSWMKYYGPIN